MQYANSISVSEWARLRLLWQLENVSTAPITPGDLYETLKKKSRSIVLDMAERVDAGIATND